MTAIHADIVGTPLFTSSNMTIQYRVYQDEQRKEPMDITGKVLALLITDPGGTTYSYTGSNDSGAGGTGEWTLSGSNHTTVGTATAQAHMDGIPKSEFELEFRAKKVAS